MSSILSQPYHLRYESNQDLMGLDDNEIIYYFAYGSNMDKKQMDHRQLTGNHNFWPDAECKPAIAIGKAVLNDYALNFSKISRQNPQAQFASILPDSNSSVEGVVYQLDNKFIKILDYYEGIELDQYTRELVTVALKIDESADILLPALVYIAHPDASLSPGTIGTPSKTYLDTLIRGAVKFGLSQETINKLQTWPTAGSRIVSIPVEQNSDDDE